MKKTIALLIALAMLLTAASAAFDEEVAASSPLIDTDNEYIAALAGKRVAVANIYLGDEWCKLLADTFEEYGRIYGFEVNNQDGNLDHDTQVKQIENFVTQQYDVILVDPANGEGIGDVLDGVVAKGIPVVTYDAGNDWKNGVAHVSGDNFGNGVKAGEMIRDYVNEHLNGEAKIVLLTLYLPHTMMRVDGFYSVISEMPGVEVISTQDCQGNREVSANHINSIGEDYQIVLGIVPNAGLGAISALEALGKNPDDIRVFTACSNEECYALLREAAAGEKNFLEGGWSLDARDIATQTLIAAGKHFLGVGQDYNISVPSLKITAENVNDYYPEK